MYEFACDQIIPVCPGKETGDTPEAVREKAVRHLHEHHGIEYLDQDLTERIAKAIRLDQR